MILLALGRGVLSGAIFALVLGYIERRRVLRGRASAGGCLAAGVLMNLLSDWLLGQGLGLPRYPLLAVLGGMALAALAAAVVSAVRCLQGVSPRQKAPREKVLVLPTRRTRTSRAA